jgi:hypothetical protein
VADTEPKQAADSYAYLQAWKLIWHWSAEQGAKYHTNPGTLSSFDTAPKQAADSYAYLQAWKLIWYCSANHGAQPHTNSVADTEPKQDANGDSYLQAWKPTQHWSAEQGADLHTHSHTVPQDDSGPIGTINATHIPPYCHALSHAYFLTLTNTNSLTN